MLKPLDPNAVVDFSLPGDEENPTVFKLKPLSGAERMHCIAYATSSGRNIEYGVESMKVAVRYGLVGWENFGDAPFSKNMDDNIRLMDMVTFTEVASKILSLSVLNQADKKK